MHTREIKNINSRFNITDDEAARIAAVAETEAKFVEIWAHTDWWTDANKNTTPKAAGFIVWPRSGNAISGSGATEDEAWASVVNAVGSFLDSAGNEVSAEDARRTQFFFEPCTAALLAQIADYGTVPVGYIHCLACTSEEYDLYEGTVA